MEIIFRAYTFLYKKGKSKPYLARLVSIITQFLSVCFSSAGTAEEIRLTVANADLALEKGEVETAINILKTIGPEQPYFLQAK